MTNFIVFNHKYKEKNGVSRIVLTFSQRTLVNHVKKPSFPLKTFCLKSYVNFLTADKLPDSEIFDLIGEVVGKEDPRDLITSKGKETKRLVIILQDLDYGNRTLSLILRNNRINCSLFDELIDHLLLHLEEERAEPLIATRWNGKTSVQNNFEISKVHINPELIEVIQFKSKLVLLSSPAASNPTRISQVSSPNAWSALDELKHGSVAIKTIEEALNSMEGQLYPSMRERMIGLTNLAKGALKKLKHPLKTDMNVTSGDTHETTALRYKLEITVHDGIGSTSLLLWDRETIQLCEKTGVGEDDYPQLLDNMMDKRVLFKLNVKSSNIKQYDPICNYLKLHVPTHIVVLTLDHDYSNLVDILDIVVNLTSDTDTHLTMDFTEESVSNLKFKTPAKRTTSGVKIGNININLIEEEGQNSTNRLRSKGTKKLKSQLSDSDV
ncbi:hypothetical protein Ahy_A01g003145 [Arachis hypogaea]|uniref:DUF223 domain-containing protein n=1 Tax=Arachis hypogaea TaxID=3818 RepID=A0A445ESA2_ARAHY|nr:hypothetical protein Ahy_A01g003145 [Arachis hypogaea]